MNEKPALEILEVSLISDLVANPAEPKQYDRHDPEGRARMAWVLGLPIPQTDAIAYADACNDMFREDNREALRGMKAMIERIAAETETQS